jgi:hypothetical protein
MPINDPIKNRKVAPASLAFERDQMRNGAIFQVGTTPTSVTYQETVNIRYGDINQLYITNQYIQTDNDKIMKAMQESEHRSKHWVSDYKRSFQWDIQQNQAYAVNAWQILAFNNEVLRAIGCSNGGVVADGSAYWQYRCPEDATGIYWVYSHINFQYASNANVTSSKLGLFLNGSLYRVLDNVDNNMMGANKIIDTRMSGGAHIPMRAGDVLTIRFYAKDSLAGIDIALYPTSVYGYVTAHRENCSNAELIDNPVTGFLYQFDHNQ